MTADGTKDGHRNKALASDRVQSSLRLYNHDIRAAVSDVIGGLRLIEMGLLNAETQEQLERVRIAGETLAELVDAAILSLDGDVPVPHSLPCFEFRAFLAGLEMRWSGRAREQGLAFRLNVHAHVPERVQIGRIKLDRILGNLVANALKFTDHGTVTLEVEMRGHDLLFRVCDQGPGFSDTALERLFTPDGRPSDATRPGTGLGLHISKDLADSLGAKLTVTNLDGKGATVMLAFPEKHWKTVDPVRPPPDLTGLSILVAEDNETNQVLVRQMLERMGARMDLARDGAEAYDKLHERGYDLALIDIEMPRMNGIEVMQRVRDARGAAFNTPLVALTAYILRDNREAIYAAGAVGVIAKPIRSVSNFGWAIRRHVDRSTGSIPTITQSKPLSGDLDRNRFEALLQAAGPEGRLEFLTHLSQDLRSVDKELRLAFQAEDAVIVRAQTHILISLAGAIGADRLQEMTEALNATAHRGNLSDAPTLIANCQDALAILIDQVETRRRREI